MESRWPRLRCFLFTASESLWSLVSDLSPLPLSPPPLCHYSFIPLLLPCQSSCPHHLPLHLPPSSTFSLMLMVRVTARRTSLLHTEGSLALLWATARAMPRPAGGLGAGRNRGNQRDLSCVMSRGSGAQRDCSAVSQTWACLSDPLSCVTWGKSLTLSGRLLPPL